MPQDVRLSDLVERMRAGDAVAVHQFFEAVAPWLRRVARRSLSPSLRRVVDTEDVVSSTIRRAFEASHRVRLASEAGALAWLATIVRNRVRTLARRVTGPGGRPYTALPEPGLPDPAAVHPEQVAVHAEELARFHAALADLSPDERECVLLHDLKGLSHAEVAECLGRPGADAARKLHDRALARLRGSLAEPAP
jgi:RNA polymerase sigma-70 factor (ECF subfamily)